MCVEGSLDLVLPIKDFVVLTPCLSGGSGAQRRTSRISMFNGDIFMVCVTEFHRSPLFCIQSLFACLLLWFQPFSMTENVLVDSGMSCSTPINPFKAGNPFTPESVSSAYLSTNVEGPGRRFQIVDGFSSPLNLSTSSVGHRSDSTNPFASESQQDTSSLPLFTHRRNFNKPIKNHADYDGAQSLRDYLKHFERCSVVNGWSQEEAALFLAAGLRGEAQKMLNGMSDSDCRNYAKLVGKLELRFGVEKQRELHQVRLHNRLQFGKESIQALAADIRSLSSLAYQELSLKIDLPSGTLLMHSRIVTTGFNYVETNLIPLIKPFSWLLNLRRFFSWMEMSGESLFRFALWMKVLKSLICLTLSWIYYVLTFECNKNVGRPSKLPCNS